MKGKEAPNKAIIYTWVSTSEQTTDRQVKDLRETGHEVVKVFSEKISCFNKSIGERKELEKALAYLDKEWIRCLLIHEIFRRAVSSRRATKQSPKSPETMTVTFKGAETKFSDSFNMLKTTAELPKV